MNKISLMELFSTSKRILAHCFAMFFALTVPLSVLAMIAFIAIAYHFYAREQMFKDGKAAGYLEAKRNFAKSPSALPRIATYSTAYGLEQEIMEPWNYKMEASRLGSRDSAQQAINLLESEKYQLRARKKLAEKLDFLFIPAIFIVGVYMPLIFPLHYTGKEQFPGWVHYLGVAGLIVCAAKVVLHLRFGLRVEEQQRLFALDSELNLLRFHIALIDDKILRRLDQLIEATDELHK